MENFTPGIDGMRPLPVDALHTPEGFIPGYDPSTGLSPGAVENFTPGIDGMRPLPVDAVVKRAGFIPGVDPGNTPGNTPGMNPGSIPGIDPGNTPGITPGVVKPMKPSLEDEHFVKIGNPRNLPDPFAYPYYWGAVCYEFEMNYQAVTYQEWILFLNSVAVKGDPHGLYNAKMAPFIKQKGEAGSYHYELTDAAKNHQSITSVSYYSAQRYCNWKENGEQAGDTERGSYDLTNLKPNEIRSINPSAHYHITSNDEYQKSHFYDPSILQNHGAFTTYPKNSYGTLAEEDHLDEWTSSMDPASNTPMIRGKSNHSFTKLEPSQEREGLGFRLVKTPSISSQEQYNQQIAQWKREQMIYESHFQDKSNDQNDSHDSDRRDAWQGAAACMDHCVTYFQEEHKALEEGRENEALFFQSIANGCEQAAAFYIQNLVVLFSKKEYSSQEVTQYGNTSQVQAYLWSHEIDQWYNAALYLETANVDLIKRRCNRSNMYRYSTSLAFLSAQYASEGLLNASYQVGRKAYTNAVIADKMTN